jgi:uncharacterized protein YjbI with pentapeptide repeats
MADEHQLKLIKEGVESWNCWRKKHPHINIDLANTNLKGARLCGINLSGATLNGSDLTYTDLKEADLTNTNLCDCDCTGADLQKAKLNTALLINSKFICAQLQGAQFYNARLSYANLSGANLYDTHFINSHLYSADLSEASFKNAFLMGANLTHANLFGANLSGADLSYVNMVNTNLHQADLTNCRIYGISVWGIKGFPSSQTNLIITPDGEAEITVDDLQVAQFIYLLLKNQNVRNVIDTITSKAVLILGRFTSERKAVLDAIHIELRNRKYLPILFDFDGPTSRDISEAVSTLAHLARFIIADITDAKSIPQELQLIVPNLPSVPIQPLILASQKEYGMFEHFKRYPWVLPTYEYQEVQDVIVSVQEKILNPLEEKWKEQVLK